MNIVKKESQIGNHTISFETGRLAQKATSSILAQIGETVVLATVVVGEAKEGIDFFPLTVEYIEKLYAGGMISSSRFIKREGRPSPNEILKARIIDRSIRPIFKDDFLNEVQIAVTVLSYDKLNDPSILAVNAVSLALLSAGLPFEGPVASVKVGEIGGDFILNPTNIEIDDSSLNLIVSSTEHSISMIEAGADSIKEERMIEAIEFAKKSAHQILELQKEFLKEIEPKEFEYTPHIIDKELLDLIQNKYYSRIEKSIWEEKDKNLFKDIIEDLKDKYEAGAISEVVTTLEKQTTREGILNKKVRPDKRKLNEIRPLYIDIDILPRTHGSALFQRGETQVLSVVTLAAGKQGQLIESIYGEEMKRYMHHYNFPGWSVGEISKNLYYPSRRDIGHGALAERALERQIPSLSEFPYAIRVVSETLASNGSSSMASVCGSTLSLMAAGVPIKSPISGVAMGLVADEEKDEYVILTDIQGPEDHFGDMDFKVAGSKEGITALQMDNKLKGIPVEVLKKALIQAKEGREFILDKMLEIISQSRSDISQYAPVIETIQIEVSKIGDIIGSGGKTIKGIIEKSGADVSVEEDGTVSVSAQTKEQREIAIKMIKDITQEAETGKVYDGKVAKITTFGAFVDVSPNISGLVHVSEMKDGFVKNPETIVKIGQMVKVKVLGRDDQGRLKLSMKGIS